MNVFIAKGVLETSLPLKWFHYNILMLLIASKKRFKLTFSHKSRRARSALRRVIAWFLFILLPGMVRWGPSFFHTLRCLPDIALYEYRMACLLGPFFSAPLIKKLRVDSLWQIFGNRKKFPLNLVIDNHYLSHTVLFLRLGPSPYITWPLRPLRGHVPRTLRLLSSFSRPFLARLLHTNWRRAFLFRGGLC